MLRIAAISSESRHRLILSTLPYQTLSPFKEPIKKLFPVNFIKLVCEPSLIIVDKRLDELSGKNVTK